MAPGGAASLCWLRKELENVDGQRLGEAIEHVDGRVFLLPLQAADVRRFSHTWKSHRRDRTGWLPSKDSNLSGSISNRSTRIMQANQPCQPGYTRWSTH